MARSGNRGPECCESYGRSTLICGYKRGYFPAHWFVGPDWMCSMCTYALLTVPTLIWVKNVAGDNVGLFATGLSTYGCTVLCYSMCACSDPGIVFKQVGFNDLDSVAEEAKPDNTVQCSKCRVWRPKTASHCYDCQMCVDELDHHCPWTGKCIGKRTIRWFYAFLTFLLAHIGLVAISAAVDFLRD
jgi:hypothetical protein